MSKLLFSSAHGASNVKCSAATATEVDAAAIASLRTNVAETLTGLHGRGHWSSCVTEKSVLRGLKTSRALVARSEGRIVGAVRLATRKPWAIDPKYFAGVQRASYLHDLAVAPGTQRQGVGRFLVDDGPTAPPGVIAYYERFPEESRLSSGPARLEFERTKEILSRVLPKAPSRIVDVGGAAGAYSSWLSERGYEVHLVDASPRLVEKARRRSAASAKPLTSMSLGDASRLPQGDRFVDAVLLMGPLYHLPTAAERLLALREALRVLVESGVVVVAAISRYASALDGLARCLSVDPRFVKIRDRDLAEGQHRNDTDDASYFTTAYFHRPEDLLEELESAGFRDVQVLGVEGPGWMLPDLDARWRDVALKKDLLDVARALESVPSVFGASAHLLGLGRKP